MATKACIHSDPTCRKNRRYIFSKRKEEKYHCYKQNKLLWLLFCLRKQLCTNILHLLATTKFPLTVTRMVCLISSFSSLSLAWAASFPLSFFLSLPGAETGGTPDILKEKINNLISVAWETIFSLCAVHKVDRQAFFFFLYEFITQIQRPLTNGRDNIGMLSYFNMVACMWLSAL